MKDSLKVDETDLALIHALQIAPRAPWNAVGAVVGIGAVTAARRWDRLVDEGLAWVIGQPGPTLWRRQSLAWVEVDCEAGALGTVTGALADEPGCSTIEAMDGGRDLLLTVHTTDIRDLSKFVLRRVGDLPGVRGTRTRIATHTYGEGSAWRLDALSAEQARRLAAYTPAPADGADDGAWKDVDRALLLALGADGRRSATDLAADVGCSEATARRRVTQLLRTRSILLRCEVADRLVGWPVTATCWAAVPPPLIEETGRALSALPELRLCAAVTGAANLLVTARLRSLEDLQGLEVFIARRVPHLTFTDRAVTLAHIKRVGAVLDDEGRRVRAVPVDPWAVAAPAPG